MGDMADLYNEGWCDEFEEDDEEYCGSRYARTAFPTQEVNITCKYCNKNHLYWDETKWGSRLFEENGTIHKCEEYQQYKANKEDEDSALESWDRD